MQYMFRQLAKEFIIDNAKAKANFYLIREAISVLKIIKLINYN
jgi:hypothetical protein